MKTIAIYALAWLLLGSAINYAQAVVFAFPSVRNWTDGADGRRMRGTKNAKVIQGRVFTVVLPKGFNIAMAPDPALQHAADDPRWALLPFGIDETALGQRFVFRYQEATGWPFRAVLASRNSATTITEQGDESVDTNRGFLITSFGKSGEPAVPLIPLWPGFLLNALIWGSPVLLIPAARGLRRARRRRRGLCPRCAYDLKTGSLASCPECGPLGPLSC